jgi:Na+/proline symporter
MDNAAALLTLLAYAVILAGIGIWASRKSRSKDAFLLGERSLGPVVAGLAYAASTSSAWVLLGFSGFVYVAGLSALWMVPGILLGYLAVWLFAGRTLQEASRERGHLTLTSFLAEDASPATARAIRIAASLLIAFCFSWYVAAQFQGAGQAFDGLFGTGLTGGVLIGAAIIGLYTLIGGFHAVSIIDTLQGLLIAVVAVILPVAALTAAGGFAGLGNGLAAAPTAYLAPFSDWTGWFAAGLVLGHTATGFGALGQPHLVAWIMAARDRRARITGAAVATVWGLLVYTGMAILGLSARVLTGGDAAPEGVFFQMAQDLLPAILAGIIAAAILSAIMSTVDSQLLVAGAAISHDLGLGRYVKDRPVLALRLAILAVCAAAIAVTLLLPSTIFARVLFAWTALGAAFGPVVVARALRLRPPGGAVLGAILTGFGLSLVFEFILPSGPGAVAARTLPWAGAAIVLALPFLYRAMRGRRSGLGEGARS